MIIATNNEDTLLHKTYCKFVPEGASHTNSVGYGYGYGYGQYLTHDIAPDHSN
jgi:hypothetical protein